MNPIITFYIARHGKTLMNTLDRVQGWCDSPLTDEGIEIARNLGAGLNDISFESVYTSDLLRSRQTAQYLLKEKGQDNLPIIEMDGFREACFGSYESDYNERMWREATLYLHYSRPALMYKDVFEKKISIKEVLDSIKELDTMGIAEDFQEVEKRMQAALYEVAEQEAKKGRDVNILLVSHGMSILTMLYNLGGKELLQTHLENGAVCKTVYRDGKFQVESMSDMSYIHKGAEIRKK